MESLKADFCTNTLHSNFVDSDDLLHKVFTFIVGIQSVFQGLFLSFPILILSSSFSLSFTPPSLSLSLSLTVSLFLSPTHSPIYISLSYSPHLSLSLSLSLTPPSLSLSLSPLLSPLFFLSI